MKHYFLSDEKNTTIDIAEEDQIAVQLVLNSCFQ